MKRGEMIKMGTRDSRPEDYGKWAGFDDSKVGVTRWQDEKRSSGRQWVVSDGGTILGVYDAFEDIPSDFLRERDLGKYSIYQRRK